MPSNLIKQHFVGKRSELLRKQSEKCSPSSLVHFRKLKYICGVTGSKDVSHSTTPISWEASSVHSMASYSSEMIWVEYYCRFGLKGFQAMIDFPTNFQFSVIFHRPSRQIQQRHFCDSIGKSFRLSGCWAKSAQYFRKYYYYCYSLQREY